MVVTRSWRHLQAPSVGYRHRADPTDERILGQGSQPKRQHRHPLATKDNTVGISTPCSFRLTSEAISLSDRDS